MCWIIASAKSERNRREQREFEQKAAKEAKIWADNMGGRKFAGVVISAGIRAGRFKRPGAAGDHAPGRVHRMTRKFKTPSITLETQFLIGLCFLCYLLFKSSLVP